MSRIVIALGGNALALPKETVTVSSQFQHAREALAQVVNIAKEGHEIVITHGNGPQVGAILIRVEEALGKTYELPLEMCVAETQGELGYVLEQSLYNALHDAGLDIPIVTIMTQITVDETDPAFQKPSKPVGPFYSKEQAEILLTHGQHVMEDAGRGWRRVVASPRPLTIIEAKTIEQLVAQRMIVIAAGGGGIPVVRDGTHLRGIEAVIDKDFASDVLATAIHADTLLILTSVKYAYLNFNTPGQVALHKITAAEAQKHVSDGHFSEGSMKPKIEAGIEFLANGGKRAIITDVAHAYQALSDETCATVIRGS